MPNQLLIKAILITALTLVALAIVWPGKGARGQAIRHLAWLLGLGVGVLAVIFPNTTGTVASWLGIGRGTDLLLYMAIIFFMGYAVTTSVHSRASDRTLTQLARKLALLEAQLRKERDCNAAASHATCTAERTRPLDTQDVVEL